VFGDPTRLPELCFIETCHYAWLILVSFCNGCSIFVILPENGVDFAVDIICLLVVLLMTPSVAHRRMIGPHLVYEMQGAWE
jgi:hypothetical protein